MKIWLGGFMILGVMALGTAPVAASEDDDASLEVAILDILLERGLIDAATYEELLGLAQLEVARNREYDLLERQLKRLKAPEIETTGGKPGKLLFSSEDGSWSMGFKGRIQVQFDGQKGESGNRQATYNNFSVRRARLAFFGNAGGEGLTYKIEFNGSTSNKVNGEASEFSLTDAYLNWVLLEGHDANAELRAGQFKVPYGREVFMSSSKLSLVDQSLASREFAPDREPGVMIYGHTDDYLFEWWASLTNGEGTGNGNSSGTDGSSATSLRHAVRVVVNPLGEVDKNMAAFQTVDTGDFKIAFGGAYMGNPDQPFDADGDPDTMDARSNDHSYELSGQAFWGPLSLYGAYYNRVKDTDVSGMGDVRDTGYTAQAGVFVVPNEMEVVVQTSRVRYDMMPDQTQNTLGFNYYVDGNNSKLALDVTDHHQNPKKDYVSFQAQYQLIF